MTPASRAYAALAVLCLMIAAAVAGWLFGIDQEHDRRVAEVATLHQTYSDAATEAARSTIARLQIAQQRSDALTRRLQAFEAQTHAQQPEIDREIKRLSTGGIGLRLPVVRLLNAGAEGGGRANGVPSAAGSAPAADAAAASDTDVALWISHAWRSYDTCRARLDALITWHEGNAHD